MKTTIALQPPMALALVYWVTVAFWGGGADGATSDDVVHDTSLGLVTRACAARYCRRGTNAVDLWVYVDQASCTIKSQPYLAQQPPSTASGGLGVGDFWSMACVMLVCVLVSVLALTVAYRGGRWVGTSTSYHKSSTSYLVE